MKLNGLKNKKKLNLPTSLINEGKTLANLKTLRKVLISSSRKLAQL